MGAGHSTDGPYSGGPLMDAEQYAIKLQDPAQCVRVYGFFLSAKRTLTWRDVLQHNNITLASLCVNAGVHADKLQRMQPSIREWVDHGKASLVDLHLMGPWRPNPFLDLGCAIADLVLHRAHLTPQLLIDSGITFHMMRDRYGLCPQLMALLNYPPDDWVALGVDADFIAGLPDDHYLNIFGKAVQRKDLMLRVGRDAPR